MKYANRFAGHMHPDDPRTPLQGAAGCTWPTVPAFRFKLRTENAYGLLTFWNYNNALLQQQPGSHEHNELWWLGSNLPLGCSYLIVGKHYTHPASIFTWTVALILTGPYTLISVEVPFEFGVCNRDWPIGDFTSPFLPDSGMGSTCRLTQVEFDKTQEPPE